MSSTRYTISATICTNDNRWLLVLFGAFAMFLSLVGAEVEKLRLTIPWPSGIVIDSVRDEVGHVYRFGRLQSNAVQMRPEWSEVYMLQSFLSVTQCNSIIQKAEALASHQGWSKARHIDYSVRPTKDHAVRSLYKESEEEYEALIQDMLDTLAPRLRVVYGLTDAVFEINDLFVTKYDSNTPENRLDPHTDKSPWSFVVSLNDGFEGGGTVIMATSRVYRAPAGGMIFFSGSNLHAGLPTTHGVRYILAGFVEEYSVNSSSTAVPDKRSTEFGEAKFFKYYDPKYDGYAGISGFKSGDRITGIEVCSLLEETLDANKQIDATISGDYSSPSPSPSPSSSPSLRDESNKDNNYNDNQHITEAKDKDDKTASIKRRIVPVTGSMTDDEWMAAAMSCEKLAPGEPTILEVVRSKSGTILL